MRVLRPYCRRMQGLLARGLFLRYRPCSQLFGFWGKFFVVSFWFLHVLLWCLGGCWSRRFHFPPVSLAPPVQAPG